MFILGIKQHLSIIWSSILKQLNNTKAGLKKGVAYIKKSLYVK